MRRAIVVGILILAGALANIAVVWICADIIEAASADANIIDYANPDWFISRHRTAGSDCVTAMISLRSVDAIYIADSRVPRWSRVKQLPAYNEGDPMPVIIDVAYGWPMLSMWHGVDALRDWETGSVIERDTVGYWDDVGLPLWIHWLGFAINSLLYAAIIGAAVLTPGVVRRHIRRKRGQCAACGYPIGSSPLCTECGKPVATIRAS